MAIALQGLECGEIHIGMKKHRGFGRCHVEKWQVWQFDLRQRSDEEGEQSPLIISDALSTEDIKVELRDGVKINSTTRTAEHGAKYDLELLQAGTKFDLCFELLIENHREQLVRDLAIALQGLECRR